MVSRRRIADGGRRRSQLREDMRSAAQVYRGDFLDVRRDIVRLPDGSSASREYIVHPGAVMIVPMLDDGRLVVERQWRYPLARVMLEFPAGKLDPGEPVLDCAVRELIEETGYRATEWARAGLLHNAIAYSTEGIEVWFARGLAARRAPARRRRVSRGVQRRHRRAADTGAARRADRCEDADRPARGCRVGAPATGRSNGSRRPEYVEDSPVRPGCR